MLTTEIIAKKRDGKALSAEEINFIVEGYTKGTIPDYQVSAWLMAVYLRGMTKQETIDLTMAMANSGETLDLHSVAPLVVDKHSTGGVGDKVSLIVAPLVASTGLPVGKMSGRGLGFTGGTLDKLDSIAGFSTEFTIESFLDHLAKYNLVLAGQTADLAPADKVLYALRDVTATVASIPLIASSIMSKKIAAGADAIVLDVKVGSGAFMQNLEEAVDLARTMVDIGTGVGREVVAVLSDMNQPLGNAVGNALEVKEAIETLKGQGPADLVEHCLVIADYMLLLGQKAPDISAARKMTTEILESGQAFAKFREFIAAQGGDTRHIDDPTLLPQAQYQKVVPSPRTGYIAGIDAREVGLTGVELGAGRAKKGDPVDPAVGIVFNRKVGAQVTEGEPLLTIHANDEARLVAARERLVATYEWANEPVEPPALIKQIIR